MARTDAGPESLTYAEARERVLAAVTPMAAVRLPLAECRGRALRKALVATHALPPFHNSSMDGYAVRAKDLAEASRARPVTLPAVEVIAAGHVASRALAAGEAMRIMTGALLPAGADAVIPVEDVERVHVGTPAEKVTLFAPAEPGQNVREAGRDVAAGATVLAAGRELSAHDLALAAALGEAQLEVSPRLKAAVISTGDELVEPGEPLKPGAIYDSNRLLLAVMLEEAGASVVRSARVPDDPARVAEALRSALAVADVVLTIGGISAGDFDPVKQTLGGIDGLALWRVAMRPGRPQAFGAPEGRLFFGLPGNPASVACTFEVLVRPALRKRMGYSTLDRPQIAVKAAVAIDSKPGRVDFVRVTLERRADGWWATPAGAQVSGHVSPQSRAHALLVIDADRGALAVGDAAHALLLRWPDADG